jgi:hypothetical protein
LRVFSCIAQDAEAHIFHNENYGGRQTVQVWGNGDRGNPRQGHIGAIHRKPQVFQKPQVENNNLLFQNLYTTSHNLTGALRSSSAIVSHN